MNLENSCDVMNSLKVTPEDNEKNFLLGIVFSRLL